MLNFQAASREADGPKIKKRAKAEKEKRDEEETGSSSEA
jgi:hypothetical protein